MHIYDMMAWNLSYTKKGMMMVWVQDQMCVPAGVVTPAVALRGTSFIQRIAERGVCFEVMHKGAPL